MGKSVKDGVVNDYQLALLSKSVFDIGPRTRGLMLMAGMVGIGLAFMASLDSHQQVPLDKIIHFSGYFTLSATFVLALRPLLFVPGLLGLITMGVVIEFLQKHTGRSFDVTDMMANTLGVVIGGMTGLIIRGIYSFVHQELAARKAHRQVHTFAKGETLIREGDPIDEMYIIKSGRVRVLRTINGRETELTTFGAGEVVGVLGVIEQKPQYATIRAIEPTEIYRMNLQMLMESAGGDQLPISLVLTGLSQKLRMLANQLAQSGRPLNSENTPLQP